MEQTRRGGDASGPGASTLAACATALFFVVYARRVCPTLSLTGDSAELVTAGALWGIPHAPGYPLFTAIAHAFTWLPLHSIAWRVHLTSAIFHAGAVGATALATFTITRNRAAALAAGCALGLQRSFFLGSLYAEVFPLNDLLFACLLLVAFRLRSRETSAISFAAVAGIAAAHHMMIALAAPALAILALPPLVARRGEGPRWPVLAAAFVVPSLIAYALVPLAASRDPALSWGDVHDARSLLSLIMRSDYGGPFSSVHGAGRGTGGERVVALGGLLVAGFGATTLAVAAIGAIDLLRRQRTIGVGLVVGALVSGPLFAWLNAVGTGTEEALAFFERFTTMCTVPIAISFGAGVAAAGAALSSAIDRAGAAPAIGLTRAARVAGSLALAGWAVASFLRVDRVDLSEDTRGIAFAHDLVLRTPERSLVLLSGDAPANAALYVCAVERACGDRVALSPGALFMPWAMAQTRRRHPDVDIPWSSGPALKRTHELAAAAASKRPVFVYPDLLEKDPLLAETFTPLPDSLLFRLWPRDADPSAERDALLASARAIVGDGCEPRAGCEPCEGCRLPPPRPIDHPTEETQLVLAYQAAAFNHARAAGGIPGAHDLVSALLARSGDYARTPTQ